jgi:hypothetical protein
MAWRERIPQEDNIARMLFFSRKGAKNAKECRIQGWIGTL